ncbi:transcriptional regulator [Spongiactinospora gelatinilytica]|uniref:Transcriptional regulator n=1 Tax=Spongiactinospora gelatinilytica TaxID=2666298 RepID=A0A2W2E0P5_9ACTN|nr:helix-turn-helix transcriptional regulator [Spongiactinospora gelatinilytica]PZG17542.1 transcriptional regulator [Spongiactinospora gelatinilytica]
MTLSRHSPTVRRRRLAAEFRRLREARGLTIDQVAAEIDWHATKLSRVETGKQSLRLSDVRALLEVLQVAAELRDPLLALAREARQRGWWQALGEAVPDWFEVYVGLESEASGLQISEAEFVPGLLQTAEYARAVHQAAQLRASDAEIERQVAVRMARQELLTGEGSPQLSMIVNEAAIRRVVGGAKVMRAQLAHLMELAHLRNLTLQVLPFSIGAHPAMVSGFHILTFEPEDADVVYIEYPTGSIYLERPTEVERYTLIFERLRVEALPTEATRDLIEQVARELDR